MKKRFSLLLVLAATFLMFIPVKVYAVPEERSDWEKLQYVMQFTQEDAPAGVAGVFEVMGDGTERRIKLLKDITAEANDTVISIPEGKTVYLDLQGHTLDRGLSATSMEGAVVNGNLLTINKGAKLDIGGYGTLKGGCNKENGGAIYNDGGELTIGYNCTICDNKAKNGGAIYNKCGKVVLNYVNFSNNIAASMGGAICTEGEGEYPSGTVEFNGTVSDSYTCGQIKNCSATYGGAIYVLYSGRLEMSGGLIDSCTAVNGGGILVGYNEDPLLGAAAFGPAVIRNCSASEVGGGIFSTGAIGLQGTTISQNRAVDNGGGICLEEKGSIFLGSNSKITDNTVSECDNNLYLADNLQMVKFGTGEDVQPPLSGMLIGVTKMTGPEAKNPVDLIAGAKASYKDYVVADSDSYEVKFKDDKLILAMKHTHDFKPSSEDSRILNKCEGPCEDFYDDKPLSLTLTPPSAMEYDGQEKTFSFAEGEEQAWSTAGLDVPEISYYKKSALGESYDKIDSTPVEAGIYQAKIDVESKTALYDFEIQKKKVTVKITPNGGEYKKTITPATAVLEGLVNGDDIKPVLTYTSKNYDSTEVPTEAGTYTVTASLPKEASNYELTGKVTAEFVISGGVTPTPTPIDPTKKFSDVPAGKWYSKQDGPIAYVVANKIMNGTGDGTTFEPDAPCTREMFVQILYNIEGRPAVTGTNPFKDVKNKWYYDAITWAVNNGVTNGKSAHTFGIGENVSREQLAQFLMNYAKKRGYDVSAKADISKFSDAKKVSSWAKDALSWANANGIVNGKAKNGKNYLAPTDNATRAECAQMLMNFQKKFEK